MFHVQRKRRRRKRLHMEVKSRTEFRRRALGRERLQLVLE